MLVVVHGVVKESVLLFKGPYCRNAFVAVLFKYVAVFCSVVLVVVGRVVKESVLFKGPYCASTFVAVLFKYVAMFCSVVLVAVGVVVAKKVVSSFFIMSKRIELFKHK